jgi:integrase
MPLADARQAARKLATSAADGIMPKRAGGRTTVGEAWEAFLASAKAHKRTWKQDESRWTRHWAQFNGRRLADVSRDAVLAKYESIGKDAPYEANRNLALLRAVYNFAIDTMNYDGRNPASRIPKARRFRETASSRYLRPDELPGFFDALDKHPSKRVADFFRLALMTGARRGNLQTATWEHVNFEAATWTLPETKSGRAVVVALTAEALDVLRRRRAAVPASCDWVFHASWGEGHLCEPKKAWQAILKAAKIKDRLRVHDLRHSLATYLAEAGAGEAIIRDALGHTPRGSITSQYTHTRLDVVRDALSKATNIMLKHANRLGVGLSAKIAAGKARGRK